jgi:DNA-binding NarL/FixJ family response regulator
VNRKIKVLLVDDHALFRCGMGRLLSLYDDLEVIGEAGTGEEALQTAAEAVPDVILMDIDMPGEGGISATAAIHAHYPHCRVLLLTGHRRYAVAGLQAGARGYVLKEADEDVIVNAIRTVHKGGVYLQPEIQPAVVGGLQQSGTASVTEREAAILRLIADGAGNRQIGDALGLSEHRVKQHISAILDKLGANDRAHAVAIAIRQGLM